MHIPAVLATLVHHDRLTRVELIVLQQSRGFQLLAEIVTQAEQTSACCHLGAQRVRLELPLIARKDEFVEIARAVLDHFNFLISKR